MTNTPTPTVVMTASEARALTDAIRLSTHELAQLMKDAHSGQVWVALGYENFSEWLYVEFGWSHARGYQLIHLAVLQEQINSVIALPEGLELSDARARRLVSANREEFLDRLAREATDDPDRNVAVLNRAFAEIKPDTPAPATTVTPDATRTYSPAVWDSRTVLGYMNTMWGQVSRFPSAAALSADTRARVLEGLVGAEQAVSAALTDYETFVGGGE